MVGEIIVDQGKVVRPSQLIRSVLRTWAGARRTGDFKRIVQPVLEACVGD